MQHLKKRRVLSANGEQQQQNIEIKTPCCNCMQVYYILRKKLKKKRDRDKQIKCTLCFNKN